MKYRKRNYSILNILIALLVVIFIASGIGVAQVFAKTTGQGTSIAIARSNKAFTSEKSLTKRVGETDLTNLLTDALLTQTKAQVAITCVGDYHATIAKGNISSRSILAVTKSPQVYRARLSGADLRTLAEVNAAAGSFFTPSDQFFFSGLRYRYIASRLPMNRVVSLQVMHAKRGWRDVDTDRDYTVVYSANVAKHFKRVATKSLSIVRVRPEKVRALTASGAKLTTGQCLANTLLAEPADDSGLPVVPAAYNSVRDSGKAVRGESASDYVGHTSKLGAITYALVAVVILLVLTIVAFFINMHKTSGPKKRRKRHKRKL